MTQVFYKLSELAALLGVETGVLRFWEKEFSRLIKPLKPSPRKKLYRPSELETFREIKRLLHEEGYTIAGARRRLEKDDEKEDDRPDLFGQAEKPSKNPAAEDELKTLRALVAEVRRDLLDLRRALAPARPSGKAHD